MTYVTLRHRGLLCIEGNERADFLQGLITNDIGLLKGGGILYACLLNAQGKFLHDFFIHDTKDAFLLDCEGGARAQDLFNRLNMYRLRRDVQISMEQTHTVYAGFDDMPTGAQADPRHIDMGWRSFEKPQGATVQAFEIWDTRRITLCIPDGSRDLTPQKSTLSEGRIDTLNGVSYDKGCYVGQELTARMHYRGLAKKHLYAIQSLAPDKSLPTHGAPLIAEHKTIGEMRSSCGHIGLAVLKDKERSSLPRAGFTLINQ